MSLPNEPPRKVVPAQLGFLAIYNPSLGTTDETIENQIVFFSSPSQTHQRKSSSPSKQAREGTDREQNNERLRQVGLAQGMVEFGRSFSDGKAVDTVETEKSRIILHELEAGWWILASIDLTVLPGTKAASGKGKGPEQEQTTEYSSREVKPAILLLGDLLRAHSTFLLHHASSMSALFVRTRRSKFMGILGRYWDTYLSTWNVMMHGNPANSLYGGIKIAACGELGVGVGEEERGSGEREVLEGFVGRVEGLVDVIVSKFGDADEPDKKEKGMSQPSEPWIGSGNEPGAEDGVIFSGAAALSRKSVRDVSHWIEDLYRWGPYSYGVIDNPSSTRRMKKTQRKRSARGSPLPDPKEASPREPQPESLPRSKSLPDSINSVTPAPVNEAETPGHSKNKKKRPAIERGAPNYTSTDGESVESNSTKFVHYLKLGYGTHWSLGGSSATAIVEHSPASAKAPFPTETSADPLQPDGTSVDRFLPKNDSEGHYVIGLLGDLEIDDEMSDLGRDDPRQAADVADFEDDNSRLLLRTLTLELEREEDARAEAEISIDLGNIDKESRSKAQGSEHTGTSNTSFESQDRNKTKKLRVVVYANKPFIFVFLFELRTDALALKSLYRSLHHQVGPLLKPLLTSTTFRASKPDLSPGNTSSTPIYDLVWDPKQLTIDSTIPNIPDPVQAGVQNSNLPWSRIEALNTHMQIINTYISGTTDRSELERTCKTSRGWWVVWTRVPDSEAATATLASGQVKVPQLINEDSVNSQGSSGPGPSIKVSKSQGTSTVGASMYSGPAHPYLEVTNPNGQIPKDKEIFLIRRASDYVGAKSASRFVSGSSVGGSESSWTSAPSKLAQGIGVDTKRYIDALLNLNR